MTIVNIVMCVRILSHTQTRFSRLRPRPQPRTRPLHYNTIQPKTTTGGSLPRGHPELWGTPVVQAGHPRYTGARKGRPWVAHILLHDRRPPDRRQVLRQTCFQQNKYRQTCCQRREVLTDTCILSMWGTQHSTADLVYSKTQTLLATLRTQNQPQMVFLFFFGSRTFVPVSWMCKKQTSVSHSSTESEVIFLDAGLRMDGLLSLDLLDVVIELLRSTSNTKKPTRLKHTWNCVRRRRWQSKTTICVQSYAWASMGLKPPLKIGKGKFKKRWPHSVSQLVRLHPFCSVIPREVWNVLCMEMTLLFQENQWTLFRCETSWRQKAGNQLYNTWGRTRNVEGGEDIEQKALLARWSRDILWSRLETCRSNHPWNRSVQLDIFENPHVQREQGGCARQIRRHCGEEKVGKIGHEGTPDFWALPKPLGTEHWQQLPIFLPLTEDTSCTVQRSWHVTWPRQQQQTGRRWWDWRVSEKQTQGSIVLHISRNAVPTWNVHRHRLGRLQKNTSHHRRIHSGRISSHQNVVQNRHCGPTGTGQTEASGHQLFVDPRESCQGWPELQESGWCWQWSWSIHEDIVVEGDTEPHPHIELTVYQEWGQCELRPGSVTRNQSSSSTARIGYCPRQKPCSVDSNRHEISNKTHNYERRTCMEWCGCSCHCRCCQRRDPRFRAGTRHNDLRNTLHWKEDLVTLKQSWYLKSRRWNRRHRFSKTLFGEEECVDMENTTAETPVTSDPKHSVNGPCWNLNVRCQLCSMITAVGQQWVAICWGIRVFQACIVLNLSKRLSRSGALASACCFPFLVLWSFSASSRHPMHWFKWKKDCPHCVARVHGTLAKLLRKLNEFKMQSIWVISINAEGP